MAELKIKKMVMHGFKSFGDRTELLFGEDFNCVMGPNGSGKSNILDSLCFVLGKSSSKSMRAEKSANLIYNGGKTKKAAKKGEVSIFFDNASRTLPSDEDTVKISRVVKANGTSQYLINDEKRTRQQVLDLLSIGKINPDGYNIILQGDIVRLVEMSSTERRQIIEEIAGISVYEEKRQKALRELDRVQERLGEAEIVLKERSKNLKELQKDRDQALKYKNLNDQIRTNKASYLKIKIDKKQAEKEVFDEKIAGHTAKLDKHKTKVADFRKQITERKDGIKSINSEIEERGEKEQLGLQKEIENLRVSVETQKGRISSCHNEIARIEQRKLQLSQNLNEINDKIFGLKQKEDDLNEQIKYKTKLQKEIEEKIGTFKKKHKLGNESEKIETRIQEIDKELEGMESTALDYREKQQSLFREKDKIEFQLQTIDEKISKVLELESAHKGEIQALKKKKQEFKKATIDLNKYLNADSGLAAKMSSIRTRLYEDRERLSKLEAQNLTIKDRQAGNVAVSKILENKRKIGGVHGLVSELGSVQGKYSTALGIAAGPRINGIVVEDDAVAAKCITFLKSNKYGSATFFPLNKIRPVPIKGDAKTISKKPGVHGFAIDLVDYDPKFKNVFSHVFGDTLVVENINTARKIGIGKIRMVSIDGDLAESSGAMVGGFRHKRKGSGFSDQDLTKKIDKLSADISKAEGEMSSIAAERQENEQAIDRLRTLKSTLEGEIIKAEKSLHLDTDDLDASKDYKKGLKSNLKEVSKELDEVMAKLRTHNQGLMKLKAEKQTLRNQISQLKNPRLIAELNAYEQKRHELTEQLIHLKANHKNIEIQKNDILGRDKDNAERITKDMDKEAKTFKDEISTLEKQIKTKSKELKVKEAEQSKYYANFKKLYDKRNKMSDEINVFETKIFKEDEESRKVEFKINTLSLENAKIKAELAALEGDFEQYKGVELNLKKTEDQLKKEINDFEKMRANIGNVNLKALEIYESVEKEYQSLNTKKENLEGERQTVIDLMDEIEGKKKEIFMEAYDAVSENFKKIFTELSAKDSEAELVLENPESLFEGGMNIKVRLSGEKFLDIRSLSGGEKTMTALAFLFAIQDHDPAFFYVLDEVDAALDKANADKLARLIRGYCNKAQYIVISHNDRVITEADILYGVSMNQHGISKVVSLKL